MIGGRVVIKRGSKEEAEKPFWISFSDLMSALMVLFLVVMSVALLAVTKRVSEAERAREQRSIEIETLLKRVRSAAKEFGGINVDGHSIDFGDRARFKRSGHDLTPQQQALLRSFIPKVLAIANDPLGKKWFKLIVVEGFTDQTGSYLYNLNLSLQRSQRVLCALLGPASEGERALTDFEKKQIRDLFLVGGYSFNSTKTSDAESRRIELRLEFKGLDEPSPQRPSTQRGDIGACAIS